MTKIKNKKGKPVNPLSNFLMMHVNQTLKEGQFPHCTKCLKIGNFLNKTYTEQMGKERRADTKRQGTEEICVFQRKSTKSQAWKEFCWKNVVRYVIT